MKVGTKAEPLKQRDYATFDHLDNSKMKRSKKDTGANPNSKMKKLRVRKGGNTKEH